MSTRNFFKNFILEQDENLVSISPDDYLELLDNVGGVAGRIAMLKPYRNKGIVITGPIDLSKFKSVGPLTGVVRVMGRLDISNTNVPNVDGITIDGYLSEYGSTMWRNKMQRELNKKMSEAEDRRNSNEWDVENGDDESERTEALYRHLDGSGEVDTVEDDDGNEVPEDKYYIYPYGSGSYGYGQQYEWLGGGGGFDPKTYDVYTEDEILKASKGAVEQLIEDNGIDAFSEWVWDGAINKREWRQWLYEFYEDYIRQDPESFDIPLTLTTQQQDQVNRLQVTIDSLKNKLQNQELTDDQKENLENKIEGLEDTVQDIQDDPQGDYDEDLIEREINNRVDEWDDTIGDFIKEHGFDKNFIIEFADIDEITDTILRSDGYGSLVSSYDGDYDTYNINGTDYYIVRVN
jgi:hypothetical protein